MNSEVIINNIDYTIKTQIGMILNEKMTEELDSMTIIINDVPKTSFEPFTTARIKTRDGENHYFYLNTYVESLFSNEGNKTYTYQINLISQTKILERIILPNLKVRNSITGTKRSIYWYISSVLKPYISETIQLSLSTKLYDVCGNVVMPEYEWNHPTAKKVLNDLLMSIPNNPCIVQVKNNILTCVELAKTGRDISTYNGIEIIEPNDYQQMSDYANNLVYDVQNVVPKELNTSVLLSPRTTEIYLTTENCDLILPLPIEEIVRAKVKVRISHSTDNGTTSDELWVIITNSIIEESKYKALASTWNNSKKAKYIHFTRGSNKITGFNANEKAAFVGGTTAFKNIVENNVKSDYPSWNDVNCTTEIRDAIFKIEYLAVGSSRYKSYKDDEESIDVSLQSSQTTGSIDFKRFTKSAKEDVNRLGNDIKKMSIICPLESIPKLNDTFNGNYYLAEKEVAYYYDFAICNLTFSKDFIKRNIYYGITSRKQYTQLAQANESVIREIHQRKKVIFCIGNYTGTIKGRTELINMKKDFMQFYDDDTNHPLTIYGIKTSAMNDYLYLPATTFVGDKSLIVTCQCEDNYNVSSSVDTTGSNQVTTYNKYVDSNGEFEYVEISRYIGIKESSTIANMKTFPKYNPATTNKFTSVVNYFNKNNAETIKITDQWDFISDDERIVLGDQVARVSYLSPLGNIAGCKFKISYSSIVDKRYPMLDTTFVDAATSVAMEYDENNNQVNIVHSAKMLSAKSLALVNRTTGELVLALNNTTGVLPTSFKLVVTEA